MRTIIREIHYAIRRLRGSPMFTIAATLTLATAIGATAAVFSLVDGVLLKAFPFRDPDEVLSIWESSPQRQLPQFSVSPPDYLDWRAQNTTFITIAASLYEQVTVTGVHEAERVSGLAVTPSYFRVLGIAPALGRPLEQDSSGPAAVVIGYGYWQRRFGGAASALGRTLMLDEKPYTIVGVMPAGVPEPAELWTRLSFNATDQIGRGLRYLDVYGRLRPGVTPEGGRRDLETISRRLAQAYPKTNENWTVVTVPLVDQLVGPVRPMLVMLLAAAACVLLIGAANLANLFLVRCLAREREIAVRTALGATHGRLARELLAEAMTVGVAAGALGIGVAVGGTRVLRALAPPTVPRLDQIGVDGRVLAFCALASVVTVLVFGLLPAWQASRGNLIDFLKEGGRGTGSGRQHRLQNGLVVLQIALALTLLTGAGLLVESFAHFRRMDPGFRPEQVLTAEISLPAERYPTPERRAAFVTAVVDRLASEPGVTHASASSSLPGTGAPQFAFTIVGDPVVDPTHKPAAYTVWVSPDYFRTMGITLQRGRNLLSTDDSRAVTVGVVDELLAQRLFRGRDPIGRRLALGGPDTAEIVGVVASVKQGGLAAEDMPELYMPMSQYPFKGIDVAVRTSTDPAARTRELKEAVAGLDRTVPVSHVATLSERVAQSVGTTRFSTFLASLFAGVALILGIVGIYSVLAYVVGQRQRELAVRIALGATGSHMAWDVLRRALTLSGLGIALGSATAWLLTRVLARLFLGVSPHDPSIFVGAAATFAVIALMAASIPALRAMRVNPVVALTSC